MLYKLVKRVKKSHDLKIRFTSKFIPPYSWLLLRRSTPNTEKGLGFISQPHVNSQSFCEGYQSVCLEQGWGSPFRFGIYLVDYGAAFVECRLWTPCWHSPSALFQFTGISQKRAYTLISSSRWQHRKSLNLPPSMDTLSFIATYGIISS